MRVDLVKIREIDSIENFDDKIFAAAVMYAEAGFYVIPIRPNSKAIPPKDHHLGYQHASRNVDTVRRWYSENGKYRGWNIGLACGAKDGIFAVDVDKHGEVNGFDTLSQIEEDYEELNTVYQETPNGGRHYIYRWFNNGASSTSKIGRGIDTRGGDGNCRSHIVAWPSTVDDKQYEWIQFGDIGDAPDWFDDLLGEPWNKPRGSGRGNEEMGEDDTERQFTPREIWNIVSFINPNDLSYERWLQVGQAIHSQHPDETGLKIWDKWSQQGDKYEANECTKRWEGFKSYGPVRVGTLIHEAKKYGFVPRPQVNNDDNVVQFETSSDYDQLIDEMNKMYGVVVVGGKVRILNKTINNDPDQDVQLMSLDDFKNLTMNKKTVITAANGNSKVVPKSAIWLADERRREYTGGIEFRPDQPTEFETPNGLAYNLFRGWTVEPKKGTWSALYDHIAKIICRGDDEQFEWVLDWMADLFQDPFNPKGCAIVIKGLEGSGKGTFFEAMGHCMGRHYKHITQEEHLTGRFNGHHQDSLLIFADEVVYGGSKKHAGVLKALVTERKLTVERKGIDAFSYNNCARVGIASNEDWFIPAGPQSRRWYVTETDNSKTRDYDWFARIRAEMDNGGIEAMMYDLLERQIISNLRRAPETALLHDQRTRYASSRKDSIEEWWADCLERGQIPVQDYATDGMQGGWPVLVDRIEMFDVYEKWCLDRRVPPISIANKSVFYGRMERFGIRLVRPAEKAVIDKMGGSRKRMFQLGELDVMIKAYEEVTGNKL